MSCRSNRPPRVLVATIAATFAGLLATGGAVHADQDGIGDAPGPVAAVQLGDRLWLADTASNLLATWELPAGTVSVSQPEPGVVAVLAAEKVEVVTMADGTSETFELPDEIAFRPMQDGQRIAVATFQQEGGAQPGPEYVTDLFDVRTGQHVVLEERLTDAEILDRVGDTLVVGDTGGGAGLTMIRLDQSLPSDFVSQDVDDLDSFALSDDGHRFAVITDDSLVSGESGVDRAPVPVEGRVQQVIGLVEAGIVAVVDGPVVVSLDGTTTPLPHELASGSVIHDSGLLMLDGDDATRWYRIDATGTTSELTDLAGYAVLSAGPAGWWFESADLPAVEIAPVIVVDPVTGTATPVSGPLRALAALTEDGASASSAGSARAAVAVTELGGPDTYIARNDGTVRSLDVDLPVVFGPDADALLGTTTQGPSVIVGDGETTTVTPIFDIEVDDDERSELRYHWLTTA